MKTHLYKLIFCGLTLLLNHNAAFAQNSNEDFTCPGNGGITYQLYYNMGGARVSVLTSNPRFPGSPSYVKKITSFEGDKDTTWQLVDVYERTFKVPNYTDLGSNYGSYIFGYICPPETGDYTFYIAADDRAELWLSPNDMKDNKVLIASVEEPVNFREYNKYVSQKSFTISLRKGAKYYVEALHKESYSSDHISVAWTLPSGVTESPIPGKRLSPAKSIVSGFDLESGSNARTMKVFPVPAKDNVGVSYVSEKGGNAEITIVDGLSNVVYKTSYNAVTGINEIYLPLTGQLNGIYYVNINSDNEHLVNKIVITQ